MKRISTTLSALALTFLTFVPSLKAGDFAEREIHGFSVDGQLFAFEEYGVQDGSGFPYSNIYVIDTESDEWTAGSPFRVLLNDENKTIHDAREQARMLAGPVMKSFENRGTVVATNRATELGSDNKRMVANPRVVVPAIDETVEFRLQTYELPASETCAPFGPSIGYRLLKIATHPDQKTRVIHEDKSVPKSRNCPLDYQLADLVTYFPEQGSPKAAVLILVRSVGFEGPDGRYLATVTALED